MKGPQRDFERLRRLDAAASALASLGARALAVVVLVFVVAVVIVVPVVRHGAGVIVTAPLNAIIEFGFASNDSGADSYSEQMEVNGLTVPQDACEHGEGEASPSDDRDVTDGC